MTNDTWYFAYGSNLLKDQKSDRTGPIRQGDERPRTATLKNYRLAFNKRGQNGNVYANIMPCPDEEVVGVIYRWNDLSRRKMGAKEGGYEEKFVEVLTERNEIFAAVTFVALSEYVCAEARPSEGYLQKIIMGAEQHRLPKGYIEKIKCITHFSNESP